MVSLEICVCSRGRSASLRRLLRSVETSVDASGLGRGVFSVLVVENAAESDYARWLPGFSADLGVRVRHVLETRIGLSHARNRLLAEAVGELILVVDDDQELDPAIFSKLLGFKGSHHCEMVYGSNPPRFESPCASTLAWFFQGEYASEGSELDCAPTNCLLLERRILSSIELPWFDPDMNASGGEDILFTHRLVAAGFKLLSCPGAIAWEWVPASRANLRYLLRRARRDANVGVELDLRTGSKTVPGQWASFAKRALAGSATLLPCLFVPGRFRFFGLFKLAQAVGMLDALVGRRSKFYSG